MVLCIVSVIVMIMRVLLKRVNGLITLFFYSPDDCQPNGHGVVNVPNVLCLFLMINQFLKKRT